MRQNTARSLQSQRLGKWRPDLSLYTTSSCSHCHASGLKLAKPLQICPKNPPVLVLRISSNILYNCPHTVAKLAHYRAVGIVRLQSVQTDEVRKMIADNHLVPKSDVRLLGIANRENENF